MGTTDWTQLWLNYHRVYEGDGVWNISLEGFSDSDAVISNAICEFKKAIELLTGEQVSDSSEAGKKALTLKIAKVASISAEGYNIKGSTNGIDLSASDANGVRPSLRRFRNPPSDRMW